MSLRTLTAPAVTAAVLGLASVTGCSPVLSAPLKVGVYEPYSPGSYGQVSQFSKLAGRNPQIVSYYSPWGMSFAGAFAAQAHQQHAEVLVQLQPDTISSARIAAGSADHYLRAYAAQVRAFAYPVILSYGQEMNGNWYSWGEGRTRPADFIAAWRHIVDVFRAAGARNVTWLWDPNCQYAGSLPIKAWWPGNSYVGWAGVDCYYAYPSGTFSGLFGPTIDGERALTSKPILIGETAVSPADSADKISDLFAGAQAAGAIGLIWFDQAQSGGPYHQDWRLEGNRAFAGAFRAAVRKYGMRSKAPKQARVSRRAAG